MIRITDRELELQAEVEQLRMALAHIANDCHPELFDRETIYLIARKALTLQITPAQLAAWREEYRDRAVVRVLVDECERARDEVALLRAKLHTAHDVEYRLSGIHEAEIDRLQKELGREISADSIRCVKLSKAREVLEFYATESHWRGAEAGRLSEVVKDMGQRARCALKEIA